MIGASNGIPVFFLGIAENLKVGTKIQYKTLEMQTFQHLFLNIPFNVMFALFKIGAISRFY